MRAQDSPAQVPVGGVFLNPLSVACLALLGLNDHLWKAQYGNWLTGKVSDFAGLVVFSLLAFSLWELALLASRQGRRPRRAELIGIVTLIAGCFAAMNCLALADASYRMTMAFLHAPLQTASQPGLLAARVHHTSDPTDLIALPALLLTLKLARPYLDAPSGNGVPSGTVDRAG